MNPYCCFILGLALFACGCGEVHRVKVSDATQPATIELVAPTNLRNIRELRLRAGGNVTGHGEIWGDNMRTQHFSGGFNLRITTPWKQTNCVLHYRPQNVTVGGFGIAYRFIGDEVEPGAP